MSETPRPPAARDPRVWIAVGAGAAAVLVVVLLVVLVTRNAGGSENDALSTTTLLTTTSTSTTTTEPPTTTTTEPPPAVANAGDDMVVDTDSTVTLTALDLSDSGETVTWTLTGPNATDESEVLEGASVEIVTPERPATMFVTLEVTGAGGDVATDDLRIDVLADTDRAVFVSTNGSNDGDGTRENPYATLAVAMNNAGDADIYLGPHPDSGAFITEGVTLSTSVYGGYDDDWVRTDVMTRVGSGARGWVVSGDKEMVISQIDFRGAGGTDLVAGIQVADAKAVTIEDSSIKSGDSETFVSAGVIARTSGTLTILRTTVQAGNGGLGRNGGAGEEPLNKASDGGSSSSRSGGAGGLPLAGKGGSGGKGIDDGNAGSKGAGSLGGAGGGGGQSESTGDGTPGAGGRGGRGGRGGDGGTTLATYEDLSSGDLTQLPGARTLYPVGGNGSSGELGTNGGGGGGGGGGGSAVPLTNGGGGGGGGGGGYPGTGGAGGGGGGGSVGVWISNVEVVVINDSTITGGIGGQGGNGGAGGFGNEGGDGGLGAKGQNPIIGPTAGNGGGGGGGGGGGQGGDGGGGAGGPSYGLVTIDVGSITAHGSTFMGGTGGRGGAGGGGGYNGVDGEDGGSGNRRNGGVGGLAKFGDASGPRGGPSHGGDAPGWWDNGRASQDVTDTQIIDGTPGEQGPWTDNE